MIGNGSRVGLGLRSRLGLGPGPEILVKVRVRVRLVPSEHRVCTDPSPPSMSHIGLHPSLNSTLQLHLVADVAPCASYHAFVALHCPP